jgi:phenylalanyl-tRNA synthetase beta chain
MHVQPLPRYPSIIRDISIIVDETLPASAVRDTISAAAPEILTSVLEFDRYQGKGVRASGVSLSLRLTFQSTERTLTDTEVKQAIDAIISELKRTHNAELRQ